MFKRRRLGAPRVHPDPRGATVYIGIGTALLIIILLIILL